MLSKHLMSGVCWQLFSFDWVVICLHVHEHNVVVVLNWQSIHNSQTRIFNNIINIININ